MLRHTETETIVSDRKTISEVQVRSGSSADCHCRIGQVARRKTDDAAMSRARTERAAITMQLALAEGKFGRVAAPVLALQPDRDQQLATR